MLVKSTPGHFTSSFCDNILSQKNSKPNCNLRKAAQSTFVQKGERKMLMKLTPDDMKRNPFDVFNWRGS